MPRVLRKELPYPRLGARRAVSITVSSTVPRRPRRGLSTITYLVRQFVMAVPQCSSSYAKYHGHNLQLFPGNAAVSNGASWFQYWYCELDALQVRQEIPGDRGDGRVNGDAHVEEEEEDYGLEDDRKFDPGRRPAALPQLHRDVQISYHRHRVAVPPRFTYV